MLQTISSIDTSNDGASKRIPSATEGGSARSSKLAHPQHRRFPLEVLDQQQLLGWVPISRTALYDIQNPNHEQFDPSFPAVIKLMGRKNFWLVQEIEVWLAARIAAGRMPASPSQSHK